MPWLGHILRMQPNTQLYFCYNRWCICMAMEMRVTSWWTRHRPPHGRNYVNGRRKGENDVHTVKIKCHGVNASTVCTRTRRIHVHCVVTSVFFIQFNLLLNFICNRRRHLRVRTDNMCSCALHTLLSPICYAPIVPSLLVQLPVCIVLQCYYSASCYAYVCCIEYVHVFMYMYVTRVNENVDWCPCKV